MVATLSTGEIPRNAPVLEMYGMNFIELNGKSYPYKYFYFKNENCRYIVATDELNKRLFSKGGKYISDEAKCIDEQIFFFLDDEDFYKTDKEIEDLIGESMI